MGTTMASRPRPRIVTLLAIFNFVFAAMFAIGLTGYLKRLLFLPTAQHSVELTDVQQREGQAVVHLGVTLYSLLAVCIAVMTVLLIVSGVGYLRLRRSQGRAVGNVAMFLAIVTALAVAFWLPRVLDGGMDGFTTINLTYPLLTLFLLNGRFKSAFVN